MRFMIIVKATAPSEAQTRPEDFDPQVMAAMASYHQELAAAGVLLDGNGLRPSRDGWRIRYRQGQPSVVDGPFAEVKDLIAGYTLIQVPSREAALAWSRRFPSPFGDEPCEVEVRQLYEMEDFQPGEDLDKLRSAGIGSAGKAAG
jgi:hypothetical protein